ncbi:MAG: hypothetical protein J6Z11_02055, partial [Candidatus Riflebacteria bacterium]|nr:hypothetical protein [Candidatus Riflebacteria bacterium]
ENNFSSHNNSRIGEENFDTSNIINLNMNLKDNTSYEESKLRTNLGEIDFQNKEKRSKKYNDFNKNNKYDAYRLSGKGQHNQKKVTHKNKIMVISQTTFNADEYKEISDVLKGKADEAIICNSICQATSLRQNEIKELAAKADAVVIVGGKNSANTKRLAQIASEICSNTKHIETEAELNLKDFDGCQTIAVSAGASTPDFITNRVIEFLEKA